MTSPRKLLARHLRRADYERVSRIVSADELLDLPSFKTSGFRHAGAEWEIRKFENGLVAFREGRVIASEMGVHSFRPEGEAKVGAPSERADCATVVVKLRRDSLRRLESLAARRECRVDDLVQRAVDRFDGR